MVVPGLVGTALMLLLLLESPVHDAWRSKGAGLVVAVHVGVVVWLVVVKNVRTVVEDDHNTLGFIVVLLVAVMGIVASRLMEVDAVVPRTMTK